jgi:hypothetical protein
VSPTGASPVKKSLASFSLNFEPQYVTQILVLESNDPGNIHSITLFDETFTSTTVYKNLDFKTLNYTDKPVSYGLSNFVIPKTASKVTEITIRFFKYAKNPEIDAVGIFDGEKILKMSDLLSQYQTTTTLVTPFAEDPERVNFLYNLTGSNIAYQKSYTLAGTKDGVNLYYDLVGDDMILKIENTNLYNVSITLLPTYICRGGAGMTQTETTSPPQQVANVKGNTTITGDENIDLKFPACKKATDTVTFLWKVERYD